MSSSGSTSVELAQGQGAHAGRNILGTETRVDEQGHGRDNDTGADSTMVHLASTTVAYQGPTATDSGGELPSFILQFANPVPRMPSTSSHAATMTETFEKGGGGARDNDADTMAMGTETKIGDPTARDQDIEVGGYSPIVGRRSV